MNRRNFIWGSLLAPMGTVLGSKLGLKFPAGLPGISPHPDSDLSRPEPALIPQTFEDFVVGEENQEAYFAAYGVALRLDGSLPLLICGPCPSGKTHLAQAVRNEVLLNRPNLTIYSKSAERFTNDVARATRSQTLQSFRDELKNKTDFFILEDVHVLARSNMGQEEYLHIFDALEHERKQMIFTSDRSPDEMFDLGEKVRSRLSQGSIVRLGVPDEDLRFQILSAFVRNNRVKVPYEVIVFVAARDQTTVRQMQGDLATLRMYSELRSVPISMELAKEVLT